jgi:hypothetical protein
VALRPTYVIDGPTSTVAVYSARYLARLLWRFRIHRIVIQECKHAHKVGEPGPAAACRKLSLSFPVNSLPKHHCSQSNMHDARLQGSSDYSDSMCAPLPTLLLVVGTKFGKVEAFGLVKPRLGSVKCSRS